MIIKNCPRKIESQNNPIGHYKTLACVAFILVAFLNMPVIISLNHQLIVQNLVSLNPVDQDANDS